jgi:hypothetical protein
MYSLPLLWYQAPLEVPFPIWFHKVLFCAIITVEHHEIKEGRFETDFSGNPVEFLKISKRSL